MFTKWLAVTALCFALCGGAMGQMSSNKTAQIKGSAVPDAMAYHMWFNHFAFVMNSEAKEPGSIQGELAKIGLSEVDQSVVKGAVLTWSQNFKQLAGAYNAKVAAGTVVYTDQVTFLRAKDALALSTYNAIKEQLSANGATQFSAFLQKEKANMAVDQVTP